MRIFRMTQLAFRLLSHLLILLFHSLTLLNRQSDFSAQLPTPHPLFSSIRGSHTHPLLSISSLFIHRVNWSIHTLIVTLVSHCLLVVSHVREHPNKWCVCACVSECLCASVCGCVCVAQPVVWVWVFDARLMYCQIFWHAAEGASLCLFYAPHSELNTFA